jgi:formylglycine-generating enzyme required for sulfatase activity
MRFYLLCFLCCAALIDLQSTDLSFKNVRPVLRTEMGNQMPGVIFDICWKNAWKNQKNHDAVWVFMKFSSPYTHAKVARSGHQVLQKRGQSPNAGIQVSRDQVGFWIFADESYCGDLDYKLFIALDTTYQEVGYSQVNKMKVYGLEMVYIPEGAFTLGSPDTAAIRKAAFYRSDSNGEPNGLYRIESESMIPVEPSKGALYYWSEEKLYNGDQAGPIPQEFPKGHDAFYTMKYELTQGQYAAFLNALPDNWTYTRSPIGGRNYSLKRGGIRCENGKFSADNPDRPMNYVSWTDGCAFADWAGLRPITELEYTKAARGPSEPIPQEFVWGTSNYDQLERYVTEESETAMMGEWDESKLTDATRPVFGASYYWVMDLSGSVWEKVITIGNDIGRNFKGTHGDGILDFGHATNADWPDSDDEKGGFGYRGGGYYQVGTYYSEFNPHSPIGYRYYGAWSGGPRYISYGFRGGRTAE